MQWRLREHADLPDDLAALPHPLGRLFAVRGLVTSADRERFLAPDYARDTHDPFAFVAMEAAVARLVAAHTRGERVGIYGDYDADGVCGATLLADVLGDLGFAYEVYIPHKERDGHGLSMLAVEHFAASGVGLIVTVDCGITNIAEVAAARERGMDAIIIDHHHVPEILPDAVAVINPKLPGSGYPFADLCGTGTAFKVACALYARMAPGRAEQTKWLLDLVAIATVADMMPLLGENRTLVAYGLIVLQKTRRVGLQELFAVGRVPVDASRPPTAHTIGFQIAPRINAAGRMGHAQDAHALLADTDPQTARLKALDLEELNTERRKVADFVVTQARAQIAALPTTPAGIVVGHDDYFHGVVGLAAGRLAEELARPVGVFQHMGDTSLGSFRSRAGIHVVEILAQCEDCLVKYGGHAQAAGATVRRDMFDTFAARFAALVDAALAVQPDVADGVLVDAALAPGDVTLDLAHAVARLAPFGIGNDEPLFVVRDLALASLRPVGTTGAHIKFAFADPHDPRIRIDGIGFSLARVVADLSPGDRVDVVARVSENVWQGRASVQLEVKDIAKQ